MKKSINILTLAALFFTNGYSSFGQTSKLVAPKASLTVAEAFNSLQQGALLVDVREEEELQELAYKVTNVIHIPLGSVESNLSLIPTDRIVILACKSGGRSQQAFDLLSSKGYTNIANMVGGIIAWEGAGLPTTKAGGSKANGSKGICCADPKSSNCNPYGTCKQSTNNESEACCGNSKKGKKKKSEACCSTKN